MKKRWSKKYNPKYFKAITTLFPWMKPYFALVSNFMQSKYQQVCSIVLYIDLYLWEFMDVHTPSHPHTFWGMRNTGVLFISNCFGFWYNCLVQNNHPAAVWTMKKSLQLPELSSGFDETSSLGGFELSRLVWLTPMIFWGVPLSCDVQLCVPHPILPQQCRAHVWCQGRVSGGSKGPVVPARWTAGIIPVPVPCCLLEVCHLHA